MMVGAFNLVWSPFERIWLLKGKKDSDKAGTRGRGTKREMCELKEWKYWSGCQKKKEKRVSHVRSMMV